MFCFTGWDNSITTHHFLLCYDNINVFFEHENKEFIDEYLYGIVQNMDEPKGRDEDKINMFFKCMFNDLLKYNKAFERENEFWELNVFDRLMKNIHAEKNAVLQETVRRALALKGFKGFVYLRDRFASLATQEAVRHWKNVCVVDYIYDECDPGECLSFEFFVELYDGQRKDFSNYGLVEFDEEYPHRYADQSYMYPDS